jgi:hypothetical protein
VIVIISISAAVVLRLSVVELRVGGNNRRQRGQDDEKRKAAQDLPFHSRSSGNCRAEF